LFSFSDFLSDFLLRSLSFHISWSNAVCLCACLDINQGGTNRNCCIWNRLVILHAQTYQQTPIVCEKPGQSDLLYGSKSPAKKVSMNRNFQTSWASQPIRRNMLV